MTVGDTTPDYTLHWMPRMELKMNIKLLLTPAIRMESPLFSM